MDFFDRQAEAKRVSGWLLAGFAIATGGVALAVGFVIALVAGVLALPDGVIAAPEASPGVFTAAAMGTALFIGVAALWRLKDLSRGGGPVARSLGGERVTGLESEPFKRRLHNVVEEMAIASGVPVPEVYVLEDEPGINAFAAGLTPADAAVAVTRGALERLTRDELQGVVAHEFSHILNGDMRMNARLMGYVFGLVAVNTAGRLMLRGLGSGRVRSGSGRGGGAVAALAMAGFAIMLLGAVGVFAARILQAAVSRQRERLADAAAVQFTRNPSGLSGALRRIAASPLASYVRSARKEEVGHMLFASGRRRLAGLLATHPPITERIRALDAGWKPGDPPPPPPGPIEPPAPPDARAEAGRFHGLDPAAAAALVGAVDLAMAGRVLALVPEPLHRAVLEPDGAALAALALLLDPGESLRESQLAVLEARLGAHVADQVARAAGHMEDVSPSLRLALLDLASPALRRLPEARRSDLLHLTQRLVELDGVISPREAVLAAALESRLAAPFAGRAEPRGALALLAVCARAGQPDEADAAEAWRAGVATLIEAGFPVPRPAPEYAEVAPASGVTAASLAGSLAGMSEDHRRLLMEALARVAAHDGEIAQAEHAVLRAAGAAMACPMPPALDPAAD